MRLSILSIVLLASLGAILPQDLLAQSNPSGWNLMEPSVLAQRIISGKPTTPVLDVGPAGRIRGSLELGPAHEKEGYGKLLKEVSGWPRDTPFVIYCGCCPFSVCPNIGPAYTLLKKLGFSRVRVLDLPHNLKEDWIDKGYPL
ncbi:MAG TPA: hypothetical protein VMV20_06340 [Chitinophagaceae bacterium]|nr:hypothetical protein [Chitinophagaceae bacterium]